MKIQPFLFVGILTSLSTGSAAWAAAINTDTALPVHQGELLWREQVKLFEFEDIPGHGEVIAVPSVLVYGLSSKFAVIGVVPYLDISARFDIPRPGGRPVNVERGDNGLGDVVLLGRYQVFQKDFVGQTIRAQLLGGLKFPTGEDDARDRFGRLPQPLQLGSGSFDPTMGAVFTWQTRRWQVDADLVYTIATEANDFEFGNRLAQDAAFEYRLLPWKLPEKGVPSYLYGVLELNGLWEERSEFAGRDVAQSGGYRLFLSPGLQYVTTRWVAEVSVQFPIVKELNGDAVRADLKSDYVINAGFRVQF